MARHIDIPEPTTLKEALELFDVMDKSFGGAKQGVKTVFDKTLRNNIDAFDNLHSALASASELRAGIVGYKNVKKYGEYNSLKNSGNDETCGYRIISVLKKLLPNLIKTLKFLLEKVEHIDEGYWGGQKCNGAPNYGFYQIQGSGEKDLYIWLTDQNGDSFDSFERGYRAYELSAQTGNGLQGSLQALVGRNNGHLQKLNRDIQHISPPDKPHDNDHGGSSTAGPPPPSPASPEHQPQSHQDDSHPPPAMQPSPTGGDSSTAAIGGAVGATGLVGGGAAVYFLNVGGIRTLIAG
ncbi:ribosome binding protein, putative [Babesia caballi]|uniref:Ribosome binding protein, putative n=1 Tax=Babesia caballi TaxID=5871 RepID=A0AAV4LMT5_BABCB|nr:ribosome binding protein, putative [Babesia caballi]